MTSKEPGLDSVTPLSKRELEILCLINDGLSNAEIAVQLYLSGETVKWYTKQIYSKLHVRGRTQALARARSLRLLQSERPGPQPFPDEPLHNLPHPLLPLLGRHEELAVLQRLLLGSDVRLLSLVGPGGIGKTHLAVELGQRLLSHFQHGVFLVSLDTLTSAEQILPQVADAIGFQASSMPLKQSLLRHLRDKQMLLIMDNFEHLLDGAELVSDMLQHAPQLQVICTSRESLGLVGETVSQVPGLPFPAETFDDNVQDYGSVQLFCKSAQRTLPAFDAQGADWEAIVRICRLVEGMPLALLLAAGWVNTLSVDEIAKEIEHALDFLESGPRDLPARQRSIRAVFTTTFNRLTDPEKVAFARFCVFRGGCTRAAAEVVTGTSLIVLAGLVNHTLIQHTTSSGRYSVHELLRQFGQEQLEASGQWEATRDTHAAFYLAYLNSLVEALKGDDLRPTLDQIEIEFPNIRAAWSWAIAREMTASVIHGAEGLRRFTEARPALSTEAVGLYRDALGFLEPRSESASPNLPLAVANLYEGLGDALQATGSFDEARSAYQRAIERLPLIAPIDRARLLRKQGITWDSQRHPEEALRSQLLAEYVLGTPDDRATLPWWREWIAIQMSQITAYYFLGQTEPLLEHVRTTREAVEKHATLAQRVDFYSSLAMASFHAERFLPSDETAEMHQQWLEAAIELGDLQKLGHCYFSFGFTRLWRNELDRAEALFHTGLNIGKRISNMLLQTLCHTYLAVEARKRELVDETRVRALSALDVATQSQIERYIATAHGNLAWVAWRTGDVVAAAEHGTFALAEFRSTGEFWFMWLACWPLAGVAIQQDRLDDAIQYCQLMLDPSQQPLPRALSTALKSAIRAWEQNELEIARSYLLHAQQHAFAGGYL